MYGTNVQHTFSKTTIYIYIYRKTLVPPKWRHHHPENPFNLKYSKKYPLITPTLNYIASETTQTLYCCLIPNNHTVWTETQLICGATPFKNWKQQVFSPFSRRYYILHIPFIRHYEFGHSNLFCTLTSNRGLWWTW